MKEKKFEGRGGGGGGVRRQWTCFVSYKSDRMRLIDLERVIYFFPLPVNQVITRSFS